MRNSPRQGLLHSFLRHSADWSKIDPDISDLFRKIPTIKLKELKEIAAAPENFTASQQLNNFSRNLTDAIKEGKNSKKTRHDKFFSVV